MNWRRTRFVVVGLFAAASSAFVAGQIVLKIGLGVDWAAPMSAVAFTIVVLTLDRNQD